MHWNAIYFCLYAKNVFDRVTEGEVMYRVAAVEQSAVNVEEIGVGGIPEEAWADISTAS